MSNVPNDLKYATSHEWVRKDDDGNFVVGITDHAQDLLGDIVFVELPEMGAMLGSGDEAGVVESVKAASDVYTPMTGEVVAINDALEDAPELVNQDPYGDGWFYKIKPSDESELETLLSATDYTEHCEAEE